jgi:hypothetical protein
LGQPAPGGNCNIVTEDASLPLTTGRSSLIRTTKTAQHTACASTRPSRSPEELAPSRAQAEVAGSSRRRAPQPPDGRGRSLSDGRILATAPKTAQRAVAASGGGAAGHLAVYCGASPGCRSVWYRPRCERRR